MAKQKYKKTKQKKTAALTEAQHKIKRFRTDKNLGIVLFDRVTMQEIREKSGPLADNCEYQTHYWCFVARFKAPDESKIDIAIPTVYFNYKQEVNSGHIDFELEEVDEISNALIDLHHAQVNELYEIEPELEAKLKAIFPEDWTMELMNTNLNTIHKHPGSAYSQSFSGTDLCTNHEAETGVVFPLAEADMKPNFAGIMAHENGTYQNKGDNRVAHFEYRIANGKVGPNPEDVIEYIKGRCYCYVRDIAEISEVESLLGVSKIKEGYIKEDGVDTDMRKAEIFTKIKELWNDLSKFKQNTDLVIPENVFEKPRAVIKTNPKTTVSKKAAGQKKGLNHSSVTQSESLAAYWGNNEPKSEEEAKERMKELRGLNKIAESYINTITIVNLREKLEKAHEVYYGSKPEAKFYFNETLPVLRVEYRLMFRAIEEEISMLAKSIDEFKKPVKKNKEKSEEEIIKDVEDALGGSIESIESNELNEANAFEENNFNKTSGIEFIDERFYPEFAGLTYEEGIAEMKKLMIEAGASKEDLDRAADATIETWYTTFSNQG